MHIPLNFLDLIVTPIFLIIFFFIARKIVARHIEQEPYYKYFIPGLAAKLFGGIALCLVYIFFYGSGDTLLYFNDSVTLSKLFLKVPWQAIRATFLPIDADMWFALDDSTGYLYYAQDQRAFMVDKITWPLAFLSFNSYIAQTLLLAFICYFPIWRLYKMFVYEIPGMERNFAIAIFFIPSVFFWGSGLLKDSISFACVAEFAASFHHLLKIRKRIFPNLFGMAYSAYLLLSIKPYIFFALLPGTTFWLLGYQTTRIQNGLLRMSLIPIAITVAALSGYFMLAIIGESLGEFSLNKVMDKAIVTQNDLKQEYYQGASFDIGEFDSSVGSMLSKAPVAINAALFRPYLWESYNPGMFISGLENFILLIVSIYLLIRLRVFYLFILLFRHHVLFFTVFFSLFFAFSVGLSTANFGALVRYKIPAVPFFVASLFIISNTFTEIQRQRKAQRGEAFSIQ